MIKMQKIGVNDKQNECWPLVTSLPLRTDSESETNSESESDTANESANDEEFQRRETFEWEWEKGVRKGSSES